MISIVIGKKMANYLIHVRIGAQLKENMNELIHSGLFSNQAELVREGIRGIVTEYYRRKALETLPKQRGMLKGKGKNLTNEKKEKLARELTPEESEHLFRHFGFR